MDLKGIRHNLNSDTKNACGSSHLMYGITLIFVAANMYVLKNIYVLPVIIFFRFSPKSHQPRLKGCLSR